jgi:hypothetical protein
MKKDNLFSVLRKYREKLPKINENANENERVEIMKKLNEKNSNLREKRQKLSIHFKDFCKLKKNNTLENIDKIKKSYLNRKDKIKAVYEENRIIKKQKKGISNFIKTSSLTLFFMLNFTNFYLSYVKKYYKLKFIRFFVLSTTLCLTLNYYGQKHINKYSEKKRKAHFSKIFSDI